MFTCLILIYIYIIMGFFNLTSIATIYIISISIYLYLYYIYIYIISILYLYLFVSHGFFHFPPELTQHLAACGCRASAAPIAPPPRAARPGTRRRGRCWNGWCPQRLWDPGERSGLGFFWGKNEPNQLLAEVFWGKFCEPQWITWILLNS